MGQIIIEKFDDDSDNSKAQGDASLQGIQFAIVNKSTNSVHHPNESYDADYGDVVTIVTTNSDGIATASKLPYGTYDVYELGTGHNLRAGVTYSEAKAGSTIYANSSYAFDNTTSPDRYIGTAVIHPDDDSNTSCVESYNVYNPVVRASLRVVKTDTEMTDVQGDADFAGIRYAIVNNSEKVLKSTALIITLVM